MPTIGDVLDGRYRLRRQLAEGGMGAVYEAEHLGLQKRVALKVLHGDIADVPGMAARFEREARATSALEHDNIVRVTDFGRTRDGVLYLAMDLLVGRTLTALLTEQKRLPIERAIAISQQVLSGLEAAHARELVHRDLKPDNVFLCADGDRVKILDFGIAAMRGPEGSTKLTHTGAILGTPAYMAPEQAMGKADLDQRVDVHAVGVLLYEMLTGTTPYQGDNYNQVIHSILIGRPTPVEELAPEIPPWLAQTVNRAMAPARDDRYTSAAELAAALRGEAPPAWKMPANLAVTDLGRREDKRPTPPPTTVEPMREAPRVLPPVDAPALELDRSSVVPAPVPAPEPVRRSRSFRPLIVAVVTAAAIAGAAFFIRPLLAKDATIDLVGLPEATLTLDGTPIVGRRLVLPISTQTHALTIQRRGAPTRVLRFTASRDQTLDLR